MGILGIKGAGLGHKTVKLHPNKPPTFSLSYAITNEKTVKESKGKVFYDQEPPSGESTNTECGFNYQLPNSIL